MYAKSVSDTCREGPWGSLRGPGRPCRVPVGPGGSPGGQRWPQDGSHDPTWVQLGPKFGKVGANLRVRDDPGPVPRPVGRGAGPCWGRPGPWLGVPREGQEPIFEVSCGWMPAAHENSSFFDRFLTFVGADFARLLQLFCSECKQHRNALIITKCTFSLGKTMFFEDPTFTMHLNMMMILYNAGMTFEWDIDVHFASPPEVQIG